MTKAAKQLIEIKEALKVGEEIGVRKVVEWINANSFFQLPVEDYRIPANKFGFRSLAQGRTLYEDEWQKKLTEWGIDKCL